MASSHRTLVRWLLIPGLSLGLFLLFTLGAAWVTRFMDAPMPPEPAAPPPALPPRASVPAPEPTRPAVPPAPLPRPEAPVREPPRALPPREDFDAPDPRHVEVVEPVVEASSGRIDAEDLRLAIQSVTPLVQQCFQDAAQRNRGTQEVKLRFTVEGEGSEGKMTRGELVSSTIPDPMVQACVLDSLLDARFPAPHLGGSATVLHPFRFTVPGDAGP
ncbi:MULTISPECIES: AgmX/PglI C-terminal domain-containing protein [unclassified Corallococcus]|uniref:AgmX/PglI C-terminal domain-containing protein n=1 Tax=unclassified Corallococcus TaxID=2685029 RepID=UPI001A8D1819|nr:MULTISPECIES: AgmX/PglI C-terminal domain-containing protein [unclassified Corallococcus]MBN9688028.1 AgmX/PglI C-terminal domain-containing protein [Corallococcus sp. NCSPR001]WAS88162.1 AgmX/PglI C-terminal domain-containing protein [Corallococcus sp. NCRR]